MIFDIKDIYKIFKNEEIEKQYILIKDENKIKAFKISINETEKYGELDLDAIFDNINFFKNKKINIVHNHIIDDPMPSFPDFEQFNYFNSLFNLFDIELEDYIIVSKLGYFSFKENNFNFKYNEKFENIHDTFVINKNNDLSIKYILNFLEENKEIIEKYNEVVFTNEKIFLNSSYFPGEDILKIYLSNGDYNTVFFSKNILNTSRLNDVNKVLSPIDILFSEDENISSYKNPLFSSKM